MQTNRDGLEMTSAEIKELLAKPTITPEQLYLSGVLQSSRNRVYEAISEGKVASFRVGKKIVIPTAPLRRQLGIDA
jgi:hypothetical protein